LDIYLKRRRGKILLLLVAVLIGVASLLYTNWLTNKMELEERNKVELWAKAIEQISSTENLDSDYLEFLMEVNTRNTTIPIIVVSASEKIILDRNIKYNEERKDAILTSELKKMKDDVEPIRIVLTEDEYQLLYYRESSILRNLKLYPIVQLVVIVIFIIVAYLAFNATQRAEQNQVWVGMSKETAHQLGTPISSLMAWIELLKLKDVDEKLIKELEQDTKRLERITERFSKIGSKPELLRLNVIDVLHSSLNYLKRRSSSKVKFEATFNENAYIETPLNAALFSWVIENICKNAIDAMGNEGKITIDLKEKEDQVIIDITDTGIGVAKSHQKTIFQPGYSTKKRGWGLGLSLAKRIVEIYHSGKIFIKWSEIGKGTTFRIILNK
jgi:signal transduction histidine kinase